MTLIGQQPRSPEATEQWILRTISNTSERVAVNNTLIVVDLVLHSVCMMGLVVFTFWLKKKFHETREHFTAAKTAYLASQVEKDLTKTDNRRAVQIITTRAEEMKAKADEMKVKQEEAIAKLDTVLAHPPGFPTVPSPPQPSPSDSGQWRPGMPDRRGSTPPEGTVPVVDPTSSVPSPGK